MFLYVCMYLIIVFNYDIIIIYIHTYIYIYIYIYMEGISHHSSLTMHLRKGNWLIQDIFVARV